MKILALNCKPDLSYFTTRGINFEVVNKKINKKFDIYKTSTVLNQSSVSVDIYAPDINKYCDENYNTGKYDIIIYGWNRKDYPNKCKNTGGNTDGIPLLPSRTYCLSYCLENNDYAIHEIHHALCRILLTKHGFIVRDFMDVDSKGRPYFLNTEPNNPLSNYAQTWAEIEPYINLINGIPMKTAILTREKSGSKETLGELNCINGNNRLTLKTLELPDLNNQKNISCIPKGIYKCSWTKGNIFKNGTYEVMNVKGRSGIRLHIANYYKQIQGCIALGMTLADINKDGQMDTVNSTIAFNTLNSFFNKEDFTLVIK